MPIERMESWVGASYTHTSITKQTHMSLSHTNSTNGTSGGTSDQARALRKRLEDGTATIGVVGLGYVGLPLAVEYANRGFRTLGYDLNTQRVERLNAGENYIDDLADEVVARVVEEGRLSAVSTFDSAEAVDVFFICVPTPVTAHKDPDASYIEAATTAIAEHLRPGQLVVLKSTTYPGTTEELVQPILAAAAEAQGLALGEDYFLAFSPERIDPGNRQFTTTNTPVVAGGVTPACTELAGLALKHIVAQVHPVSNPKVGEMEKLLENIFRSVNIALVNEMARLCDRLGEVSIWEVVEAAASKPFGFMPFYPGPGLGGHCIPIDPYYLSWMARRHDFETSFITLAARVNEDMPYHVAHAVVDAVARQPVALRDARVLVLGAAFKKNVDDTRHAPTRRVIALLREKGIQHIQYSDPHVSAFEVEVPGQEPLAMESVELTEEALQDHHVTVILTDHDAFPYERIARHARLVVDTRNALGHVPHDREKVLLLGGGRSLSAPRFREGAGFDAPDTKVKT